MMRWLTFPKYQETEIVDFVLIFLDGAKETFVVYFYVKLLNVLAYFSSLVKTEELSGDC